MIEDKDETPHREIFLDAVRAVAGDRGVARILDARGGNEVKVPICPTRETWISEILGYGSAVKICKLLAMHDADGRPIAYPKFSLALGIRSRIKTLITQVDACLIEGQSASYTARLVGVHERTVWRRRSALKQQGLLSDQKPPISRVGAARDG